MRHILTTLCRCLIQPRRAGVAVPIESVNRAHQAKCFAAGERGCLAPARTVQRSDHCCQARNSQAIRWPGPLHDCSSGRHTQSLARHLPVMRLTSACRREEGFSFRTLIINMNRGITFILMGGGGHLSDASRGEHSRSERQQDCAVRGVQWHFPPEESPESRQIDQGRFKECNA